MRVNLMFDDAQIVQQLKKIADNLEKLVKAQSMQSMATFSRSIPDLLSFMQKNSVSIEKGKVVPEDEKKE